MLTLRQVGLRLGASRPVLVRLIRAGRLIAYKVGRDYRVDEAEVERFLAAAAVPGGQKATAPGGGS